MNELKINGIYKHYTGDLYIVEDVAYHSETCEKIKNSLAQYGYESVDQCLIQTAKAVEKEIELDEIDFADLIFGDLNK